MATVNLGNIKFNWKGTYNAGTAYAIDDVVSYNGSSYVCISATTGNLPTVTAKWDVMSSAGTNGTNGTDVGTTITTQGDLLYRDGSGLQRLGAGTSGYYLKTQGTGANPVWAEVSAGGLEHIATTVVGSDTGYVNFNNCFTADYDVYRCHWSNFYNGSTDSEKLISYFMDTSGNHLGSGQHEIVYNRTYGNAGSDGHGTHRYWGANYINHVADNVHRGQAMSGHIDIFNPRDASNRVTFGGKAFHHDGTHHRVTDYAGSIANNVEVFGINFSVTGGAINADSTFSVYGYKKS